MAFQFKVILFFTFVFLIPQTIADIAFTVESLSELGKPGVKTKLNITPEQELAIASILTVEQKTELRKKELEKLGPFCLALDPHIAKALGYSREQRGEMDAAYKKFTELRTEADEKIRKVAVEKDEDKMAVRAQRLSVRRTIEANLLEPRAAIEREMFKLLTEDQLAIYRSLKGPVRFLPNY